MRSSSTAFSPANGIRSTRWSRHSSVWETSTSPTPNICTAIGSLVQEYPLSKDLLALSHVWQSPEGTDFVIAAKGAPEAIFDLCHLDEAQLIELNETVSKMANQGLRVLGVAKAGFSNRSLPEIQHDFTFTFLGLVGLADPIRPTVPNAIKECYTAGIRVVMITGDYPGTAQSIARQIGLKSVDNVITGSELDRMSDQELQARIKDVDIFARVVPEQKLRLVNALKANREVVAMTGDGVNDAPALKSAHIGIAMGGRGTDVARESSSLVLLDDDFSSIVGAVRLGRRIFDNIKKAMAYIVSVHVPIAGMSFIPVVMQWPLVLLPMHIVFLELIIDPACSVVFEAEAEESNVMRRPPRNPEEPLFGKSIIMISLLQGFSVLVVVLLVFLAARSLGRGEDEVACLSRRDADSLQSGVDSHQPFLDSYYLGDAEVAQCGSSMGAGRDDYLCLLDLVRAVSQRPVSLLDPSPYRSAVVCVGCRSEHCMVRSAEILQKAQL